MFKRLGTFVVLAVCLFAIAIVMGSCGGDDTDDDDSPMGKLTGTYSFVKSEQIWHNVEQERLLAQEAREPPDYVGELRLRPEGNGWTATFEDKDGDRIGGNSGPTWTANDTTITFTDSDGEQWREDYTLEGQLLTMTREDVDGDYTNISTWRNTAPRPDFP